MTDSRLIKTDGIAAAADLPLYPTWRVPGKPYRMKESQKYCLPVKEKVLSKLPDTPIPANPFSSDTNYFEVDISGQDVDILEKMFLQFTITNPGVDQATYLPSWFFFSRIQTYINNRLFPGELRPMAQWTRVMTLTEDDRLQCIADMNGFAEANFQTDAILAAGASRTFYMPLYHWLGDIDYPLGLRDDKIVLRFCFAVPANFQVAGASVPTISNVVWWAKGINYTSESDRASVKSQVTGGNLLLRFADSIQEQFNFTNVVAGVPQNQQVLTLGDLSHTFVYAHPTNPTATQMYLPQGVIDNVDLLDTNSRSLISIQRPIPADFNRHVLGADAFKGKSFTASTLKQYLINFSADPQLVEEQGIALGQASLDKVRIQWTPGAGASANSTLTCIHKILSGILLLPGQGIEWKTVF